MLRPELLTRVTVPGEIHMNTGASIQGANPLNRQNTLERSRSFLHQLLSNMASAARERHDEEARVATGAFLLTRSDPLWFTHIEPSELESDGSTWPPDILGILEERSQGVKGLVAELSTHPLSEVVKAVNGFCPVGNRHHYHQQIALNAEWRRVIEVHRETYMR